jgi:hypothetical protein
MRVFGFDLLPNPERLDHLTVVIQLNRGAMLQTMSLRQITRLAANGVPALQWHDISRVLAA